MERQRFAAPPRATRGPRRRGVLAGGLLLWTLAVGNAWADTEKLETLKRMSIDDLANLEVSIVSGRPERLGDTAAAVFVITAEDIRRSGATTLADVLRMVPGLAVGRIDTSISAISARGFQNQFANKLLVLIDGRSVYSPVFSGVYWDSQDIVLQDIERIEVVRGPGATTWGANAVNGVINILTKRAEDTQGAYVGALAGDRQRQLVARQGGRLGESGAYRLYAKLHQDDLLPTVSRIPIDEDSWQGGRVGFRSDWPTSDGALLLEGEIFEEDAIATDFRGHYLLGRWEQRHANGAVGTLQGYYNRLDSDTVGLSAQIEDTLDVEYRLNYSPLDRHTLSAGVGYRWVRSDLEPKEGNGVRDPVRADQLFSAFLQDDIRLGDDQVYLTLGAKLEHNDYTGFEAQPSARLRWSPTEDQTLWAAVSRAVRTPSRGESDITFLQPFGTVDVPIFGNIPLIARLVGNPAMVSEELLAYEAGFRWQLSPRLSLDTALFLHDYDQLRTIELVGPPTLILFPAPTLIQQGTADNKLSGQTHGVEITVDYQPFDWWRIQGAYAYLHMDLQPDADSTDAASALIEEESPAHQLSLRSSMDMTDALELDLWLRYIDDIPALAIKNYLTLDARLGWRVGKHLNLSLVGRNLLDSPRVEYKEYGLAGTGTSEVEREGYLMAEWRF
jgi:iron complex outermembrane receptor protein